MFSNPAIPFEAYDALEISDSERWLLVRLGRTANALGECFRSIRKLAAEARVSPATVCRRLKRLAALGCFTRERDAGRVYRYVIAEPYRTAWRSPPKPRDSEANRGVSRAAAPGVSRVQQGVSHGATQEVYESKYIKRDGGVSGADWQADLKWRAALRRFRDHGVWVANYGPLPGQPGCRVPQHLLTPVATTLL
jgi:DNA-binding transcriptional MocR family regulator